MECLLSAVLAGVVGLVAGWLLRKKNVIQYLDTHMRCPYFLVDSVFFGENMRESKRKYLEEYEKYKDINIQLNEVYSKKSRTTEKVEIIEIDEESEMARIKNLRTEVLTTKTLHWCRKNLIKD